MSSRVWALGEALAALVPQRVGPAEQSDQLRVGVGGAELNTSIGLARLGHDVSWVGVVGDDPWGRRIVRELRAEGVDARPRTDAAGWTAAYLRERRTAGVTRATYLRAGAAGSKLDLEDLERLSVRTGDLLYLTGITPALSASAHTTWLAAAEGARAVEAAVVLDVNHRTALWSAERARSVLQEILPHVTAVLAGVEEAALLTGEVYGDPVTAGDGLRRLLPRGVEVVIKNGASGSVHFDGRGRMTTGHAVRTTVCDVVGAGDAFAAGYVSGCLDHETPAQRLARGHACAGFVVATDGDWEGAPRRDELARFAEINEGEVVR